MNNGARPQALTRARRIGDVRKLEESHLLGPQASADGSSV